MKFRERLFALRPVRGDGDWKERWKDPQRWMDLGEALVPWLVGALGALVLAWGIAGFLGGMWTRRAAEDLGAQIQSLAKNPPRTAAQDPARRLEEFREADPFGLTRRPQAEGGNQADLSSLTLVGTLPGIGAWIRAEGVSKLVLMNQAFRGFQLVRVDPDRVYLLKDEQVYKVFLYLSGSGPAAPSPSPSVTVGGAPVAPGSFQAASEGKDGTLSRDLLDKLLMNPYDELAKVRLIPQTSGDVQGMRVESIQADSVLGQLGVGPGDTIQALNGVPIRNLSDVANAVNSLLGGSRMDVTVLRQGKPVNLGYAVK